jgi:digeranylgeranylglycerophospholipid reductase
LLDVIIIGGGPSGLHAARCLSSDGFEVEVLEEHSLAGEPVHCTGIVSPDIFEEFALGPAASLNELHRIRFFSPKGHMIRYQTENVEAIVLDRTAFDQSLLKLACARGAQVRPDTKAERIEILESGVTVHCSDGIKRKARACILATGSSYMLHRDLGIGFPPVFLNCAQIELPANCPGEVEIHLGGTVAPKGFGWVVPVTRPEGTFARIGLMCDGNAAAYLNEFLLRLSAWGISLDSVPVPKQRMLPLAPIRKAYGNRFLVAGDAAGFVKPTTGGGIYYGMISAGIAADVLAGALHRGRLEESALALYQKQWQQRLMEEMEAQLTLRLLLQRLTDEELENIFDLWATDGLMPLIRKSATLNHHRKLILAIIKYPAMRKILFRKVRP